MPHAPQFCASLETSEHIPLQSWTFEPSQGKVGVADVVELVFAAVVVVGVAVVVELVETVLLVLSKVELLDVVEFVYGGPVVVQLELDTLPDEVVPVPLPVPSGVLSVMIDVVVVEFSVNVML